MNNKKMIHRFNDDLAKIQNHQTITSTGENNDYTQTIRVANQLFAFSSAPLSQSRLQMRQRILENVSDQPRIQKAKFRFSFAAVLGVCLVLVLFLLTIPPVRAIAQTVLQQIGNFFFVNQPSDAENYVATIQSGTPTPTLDPTRAAGITPQFFESQLLTPAEASEKAGYPVYTFGYIPDGYTLSNRDILFTGQTITADTSYRMELDPPLQDGLQFAAIIALDQTLANETADPWIRGTGDIPVIEVKVRGVKGGWIEQLPVYPFQNEDGDWNYARWNQLIWSENGFTFVLQTNLPSDRLSLDQLLQIAESLQL